MFFPFLVLSLVAPPSQAPHAAAPRFVELPGVQELSGRLIARPLPGAEPQARAAALAEVEPWLLRHYPEVDEFIVAVPEGWDEERFAAQLLASGAWQYVHPDWVCYPLVTPNDPNYGSQWHHATIHSAAAWDLLHDAPGRVAAFTDTGVDVGHPDLAASLVPGYNAVDKLAQSQGGDVTDINGHGTAVAGTIGAIGDNGIGVAGVAWHIGLMPVRVSNFSSGGAYLSDLLDGARWAVDNGAQTISASYTGVQDPAVQTTGAYVRSQGGLYFYAADNYGSNHSGFDWADVVVVGATDQSDSLAWFSSYGLAVDLVAPGVDIWTSFLGGGYGPASGTSFATPMANGSAALLWAANPYLDSYAVEGRLYASCDDLGAPGEDNVYGHGRVNLERAVHAAVEGGMELSAPALTSGAAATFSVSGAPPAALVFLAYSLAGPGVFDLPPLNTTMGLLAPVEAARTPASGAGNASFTRTVPPAAAGLTVWLQAVTNGDTSDVELRTVL